MPRYFFNVYDGVVRLDNTGDELPDVMSARREAIRIAGSLLEDAGSRNELGEEWRLEVVDASGLLLFRLDFSVTASSAVGADA